MMDASILTCALTVDWLIKDKCVTKTSKWKSSTISLIRNEFREIYLQAKVTDATFKFRVENIIVHKKFVSEGKATIHFHSHPAVVYISNAPASHLLIFLKTMFIKMSSSKSSPKVPLREQLISNKDRITQEISPISNKDVTRLSSTVATSVVSQAAAMKRRKATNDKSKTQVGPCYFWLTTCSYSSFILQLRLLYQTENNKCLSQIFIYMIF